MSIYKDYDDTPAYKLVRKEATQTSKDAANDVSSCKMLALVHEEGVKSGIKGITTKEIRNMYPHLPYSSITARPAQLEDQGDIFYQGDKRDRCRAMRASKFKGQGVLL